MRSPAWLALSVLVAAAPLAGAEGTPPRTTLAFDAPDLPPGVATTVEGNLTYSYDQPSANASSVALAVVGQPAWAEARIEPAFLAVNASGAGPAVVPVRLVVRVANGTAAGTQGAVRVAINASENPPIAPSSVTSDVPLRVAYAGNVSVAALGGTVRARPGDPAQVALVVRNHGNGDARVRIEAGGLPKEVRVPAVELVVQAGEERPVNVSALADAAGSYPLQLRWHASYAFDERSPTQDGQVPVALEVRSAGAPVPAALALAALALAARRRR